MIDTAADFSKEVEILAQTFHSYIAYGVQMQLMYLAVIGILFKFSLDALNTRRNNLFGFLAFLVFCFAVWVVVILCFHEKVINQLLNSFEKLQKESNRLDVAINQYVHDVGYFQNYLWAIIGFHGLVTLSVLFFLFKKTKFSPK